MAASDDLEPRVSNLENQVQDLDSRVQHSEHDAAAARVLAGGADHDVHEVRTEIREFRKATISSFNAMREDFTDLRTDVTDLRTEMNHRFDEMNHRFAEINGRFGEVDTGFTEMRGKFDGVAAGQQQIVDLLNVLIAREGEPAAGQ